MIMCVLLCYPVSIRIYYQQGVLFLVVFDFPSFCLEKKHFVKSINHVLEQVILCIAACCARDIRHVIIPEFQYRKGQRWSFTIYIPLTAMII